MKTGESFTASLSSFTVIKDKNEKESHTLKRMDNFKNQNFAHIHHMHPLFILNHF
jgi:hypothetical protein